MGLFKRKKKETNKNDGCSIYITDKIASSIFQEILKDNGIPFVCRQPGAGGYIKIVTGGLLTTDEITVDESEFERATSLYQAYFENEFDEIKEE